MIEVAHCMSRVRFSGRNRGRKRAVRRRDRFVPAGGTLGRMEKILRTVAKAERCHVVHTGFFLLRHDAVMTHFCFVKEKSS